MCLLGGGGRLRVVGHAPTLSLSGVSLFHENRRANIIFHDIVQFSNTVLCMINVRYAL